MKKLLVLLAFIMMAPAAQAGGTLSDNIRIDSQVLGYALQYRVYRPETVADATTLRTLYVTDGHWYLGDGGMVAILDEQIASGAIEPVMAVFVDARNPDDLKENRRNQQFMCNQDYARFFGAELVPAVEAAFATKPAPGDRAIMGLSFGALNAGCFGLLLPDVFGNIAMQSPANDQHVKILTGLYHQNPVQPIRIFMSVGTKKDNTTAGRRFMRELRKKGYPLTYIEVPFGHEWANWKPLIDDVLLTFFRTGEAD
ncbi:MAG: esterase family protein [Alphaproteobacteria bacterium]|nr:MAG: esterase family protein [Alphaproteobacteria bacterium]